MNSVSRWVEQGIVKTYTLPANTRIAYIDFYPIVPVTTGGTIVAQGGYIAGVMAMSYNVNRVNNNTTNTLERVSVQAIGVDWHSDSQGGISYAVNCIIKSTLAS